MLIRSAFRRAAPLRVPAGLFLFFLLYFIFGTGWQEPAQLVLRGQATGGSPLIRLRWDSGSGFNDYEQREFRPDIRLQDSHSGSAVTFGAAAGRAICAAVVIDGKEIDLHPLGRPLTPEGELRFDNQERLTFTVQAGSHVGLRFRTDAQSGKAFVSVNGRSAEPELRMTNVEAKFKQLDFWLLQPDGSFSVTAALPRYPVPELEVSGGDVRLMAVELHGKGRVRNLLPDGRTVERGALRFNNALAGMRSFLHPLQLCQQILFALLSVWLLMAVARIPAAAGGLRACFLAENRYWFWLMLGGCSAVFGAWLAAFWPGVMSVDSMKIWRAAQLPDIYQNDHPLLNVICYKYLYQLWPDPAVVPVAQVMLTSLLLSWSGFWIYRQGVSIPLVLAWLLFALASVPVGVYNVMLWKDIPFALLVGFWAVMLAKLRQEKNEDRLRWTKQRLLALLLLGLALGLIRHNGIVYLAVLPALFLLLRLVPLKTALAGAAALLLAAGLLFMQRSAGQPVIKAGFFTEAARRYSSTINLDSITQDAQRTMRDYLTVLDSNATPLADKFHYYFQDRAAWWFLLHSGWWELYPYQQEHIPFPRLRQQAMRLYERSYERPWVWLSWNPVWLLALLPLGLLLFPWLPKTSVLCALLLAGTLPLTYLQIFNWRYYYFLYFGLLFLPAFISLDLVCRKRCASLS